MAGPSAIRAGRAFVELFADDSALVRTLRRAEARVVKFGENIKAIGRRLSTLGLAAGAPFAASMKVFADFDDQMRFVKSTTQATGEEFDRLTEKAKFLGRTTSFTASQVAGGMVELGRAGFAPDEIDSAISGMLDLARATGTDLASATEIAGNTLRRFNLDASEMTRVSDVLVATANLSAQTLTDLGEAMKDSGPLASSYGMSLEELTKTLGALANFGIKGSMAGTTMKNIMTRLANSGIQKKFDKLGVAVSKAGKMRNVADILHDVGKAIEHLPNDKKLDIFSQLFGLRAIAGGAKLTVAQFDRLNEGIDDAAGLASKTAKEMDSGIGGSLRMMWSAVEGVAIAIGEALAPSLQKMTDWLTAATSGMVDYLTKNKQIVVQAAKFVSIVTGAGIGLLVLGAALIGVGKIIGIVATAIASVANIALMGFGILSGAISTITMTVGGIAAAFSGLAGIVGVVFGGIATAVGAAFSVLATVGTAVFGAIATAISAIFSPIGLAILAIAALAVACILVYRNATAIGNGISKAFSTVTGAITRAVKATYAFLNQFTEFRIIFGMIEFVKGVITGLGKTILWVANSIVKPAFSIIFGLFRRLAGIAITAFKTVCSVAISVWAGIFTAVRSAFKNVSSVVATAFDVMGSVVLAVFGKLASLIGSVLSPVLSVITKAFRGIGSIIKSVIMPIAGIFRAVTGAVVAFARSFFVVESSIQAVSLVGKVIGTLVGVFRKISGTVVSVFSTVVRAIPGIVGNIISFFGSLPGNIAAIFGSASGMIGNAFSGIVNVVRNVVSGIGNLFSGLGRVVSGFGNFFLGAFANFGTAVDWLREQFGSLLSFTTETFGAIVAALGRGDIEAAIQVVWATIQLVWAKGCHAVVGTWHGMIDSLQGAWNSVQNFWNTTVYAMRLAWSELSAGIVDDWKWAERQIARGVGYIIAQMEGLDAAELDREINADYNRQATKREEDKRKNQEKAKAEYDTTKADLTAKRKEQQEAYKAKLGPLEQAERDAKEAYRKAIEAARNPAENIDGTKPETLLDKLKKEIGGIMAGFSAEKMSGLASMGTFSAFAVNTVAESNYAQATAKATAEMARRLASIEQKLDDGDMI